MAKLFKRGAPFIYINLCIIFLVIVWNFCSVLRTPERPYFIIEVLSSAYLI